MTHRQTNIFYLPSHQQRQALPSTVKAALIELKHAEINRVNWELIRRVPAHLIDITDKDFAFVVGSRSETDPLYFAHFSAQSNLLNTSLISLLDCQDLP